MKLHLGCYDKKIHGYVNVDIRPECNPDIVDDCTKLEKFEDGTVDEIYACHIFEHFSLKESINVLDIWTKKLKKGGKLKLAVPNIEKACALYLLTKDLNIVRSMFWGSQRHDYDFHKCGWDFERLKSVLVLAGYKDIYEYEWQSTEHAYVDDYSQSYFPDMCKEYHMSNGNVKDFEGVLLSLNVVATKI